ncbi:MAG: 4-phosphoerythronate dehydrogenase [Paludibacteraceae bacterium]|nr:4-phosphoerythronate dehydrogenase [Paludibacteraceae bacterium]
MKVLIDKYIPFLDGVLDPFAQVEHIAPEDFTPARVHDADALVVRTRTPINQQLLGGSRVRFVATATIGYDHIDTAYCQQQQIFWTSCPGCNAQAVCDYVEEVLTDSPIHRLTDSPCTLGVVGVGHVGTKVAAMAERHGYRVLLNDPPRHIGVPLSEIAAQCDIITFHTPLDQTTRHLCNADFLAQCQPHALIINAARGGIVDEQALLNSQQPYVIDCWENEPLINPSLLLNERCVFASYHIAGYSQEGKMNASQMCLDAFCHFWDLPALKIQKNFVPLQGDSDRGWLQRITDNLKNRPNDFEQLRKQYILR